MLVKLGSTLKVTKTKVCLFLLCFPWLLQDRNQTNIRRTMGILAPSTFSFALKIKWLEKSN